MNRAEAREFCAELTLASHSHRLQIASCTRVLTDTCGSVQTRVFSSKKKGHSLLFKHTILIMHLIKYKKKLYNLPAMY